MQVRQVCRLHQTGRYQKRQSRGPEGQSRAAKKAAGDSTEQEQRALKRAALRAAGDRTEQEKDTKAKQLKRAALRESRLQMA